eukprot:TRINITY_DN66785_c2_g2_i1.p1 TRINITY_DN66785_c2_g2~~TRINITY_DN66785_c2_g2_i1.p1  ORF type:complete len:466 (+),score=48.49 TRINITY_DN66785_c2_g2_i1:26-1399(+)
MQRKKFNSFVGLHQEFANRNREYAQQFFHLYNARLSQQHPAVEKVAKRKWNTAPTRILNVKEGTKYVCIGILYKEMKLKPNFLHDYLREIEQCGSVDQANATGISSYTSEEDFLILEDDSGRMNLKSQDAIVNNELITGVVVAVYGQCTKTGAFVVEDWCSCGLPTQTPCKSVGLADMSESDTPSNCYLGLVSGISVGSPHLNKLLLQLMVDMLSGNVGNRKMSQCIARLIIAGNCVAPTDDILAKDKMQLTSASTTVDQTTVIDPMQEFDSTLQQLCQTLPVDLMAGETDPTNCFLPQQPFHPLLLPKSKTSDTLSLTTNPYKAVINQEITVLGTSGQNISDILKYVHCDDVLKTMQSTLEWGNIAPTCPDTLSGYPFSDTDPFVLQECPHVYFAGNQKEFGTKLVRGDNGQVCRLVAVPEFHKQPTLVLVDLNSPEFKTTQIKLSSLIASDRKEA